MQNPSAIRAVTFDVGGTLIDPWPSVGHVYAEVAARHGVVGVEPAELSRRFLAAWRDRPGFDYTEADWAAVVDQAFAGLTTRPPSQTFFPELYARFAEPAAWRVYDDVQPTLDALARRGCPLGIISNWDARLQPLLTGLGLAPRFETIVISCEVGAVKPAAEIFGVAARRLGVDPGAILHIGDSHAADFIGARTAGLAALHLRRGGATAPDEIDSLLAVPVRLAGAGGT